MIGAIDGIFRPLGFDMEWRFYWSNGTTISRRTALVQIGDDKIILLIQLSAMARESNYRDSVTGFSYFIHRFSIGTQSRLFRSFVLLTTEDGAQRVMESPDIVKLGVNIRGASGIRTFFLLL